jgi:glycine/D-amino acid oxidase-like deaminating enzyme
MSASAHDARAVFALDCDVLVVGGGAAGLAAAVTAARQGAKVVLLERYGFCGGAAVAGLSGTVCGLYAASDNPKARPDQVVRGGFVDDFVRTMEAKNGLTGPVRYGKTFTRVHDPLVWRETADALLQEAGVTVLFHSTVIDALSEGERIGGVVVWTKQGRGRVTAKVTIDASGDGDVAAMAGLRTFMGDNGQVQNPTMIFRLQDVDVARFLAAYGEDSILAEPVMQLIKNLHNSREYALPRAKVFLFPTPRPGELLCNATRILGRDGRELNPINVADITEAEIEGRKQVREYARFFRDRFAGCENSFVNDTGVQVGVRQTRQVQGVATLRNEDVLSRRKQRSAVARSPWPIELHKGDKPRLEWLIEDYYEVPYECFVPERGESLLVAGRCLSAEHEAMASARVTGPCFAYGQAVGLAAAIAARDGIAPRKIDGTALRDELRRSGVAI